ncbi:hypothetical protein [Nonomuraea dietziae]|uniref:hypothetical protein n=1 Tax=Nonomuraea dietziae TaxID=65515 RepID=UPI0033CFAECA
MSVATAAAAAWCASHLVGGADVAEQAEAVKEDLRDVAAGVSGGGSGLMLVRHMATIRSRPFEAKQVIRKGRRIEPLAAR